MHQHKLKMESWMLNLLSCAQYQGSHEILKEYKTLKISAFCSLLSLGNPAALNFSGASVQWRKAAGAQSADTGAAAKQHPDEIELGFKLLRNTPNCKQSATLVRMLSYVLMLKHRLVLNNNSGSQFTQGANT